jgi:hypothetical protein
MKSKGERETAVEGVRNRATEKKGFLTSPENFNTSTPPQGGETDPAPHHSTHRKLYDH